MSSLKLGPRGEALIKSYETLQLKAYLPTPNDVPTIGWGHTRGVRMGDVIWLEDAQAYFGADVADAVVAVNRLPCALTQSMFDALVSLVFDAGASAIGPGSTIGRTLISRPDYFTAWSAFALWRKQAGNDLLGLARRRAREMTLFFEDGLP